MESILCYKQKTYCAYLTIKSQITSNAFKKTIIVSYLDICNKQVKQLYILTYLEIFYIWVFSFILGAQLFHVISHINNSLLAHLTPWSPSPYRGFSLANTWGKSLSNVISIHWRDQINVVAPISMGKYNGNDP